MDLFLSQDMVEALTQVRNRIDERLNQLRGQVLVWRRDRVGRNRSSLAGRMCEVTHAIYDKRTGEISVLVKTYSANGEGFINDNDSFHRRYRGLSSFEPLGDAPPGFELKRG